MAGKKMEGNKMAGENGGREWRKNLILNNPKIHQLITTDKQSHKEPVAKRIIWKNTPSSNYRQSSDLSKFMKIQIQTFKSSQTWYLQKLHKISNLMQKESN